MSDAPNGLRRTIGYTCGMCGVIFLLKARFDAHREAEIPAFAERQAELRKAAEQTWRRRQQDIGRITPAGEWTKDWRPGIEG